MFQLASAIISIIGQIAHSPGVANSKVDKIVTLVSGLLSTASQLFARGEEGIEDLKVFKAKIKELRARTNAGEQISDELLAGLFDMKAESDAIHRRIQDLHALDEAGRVAAGMGTAAGGTTADPKDGASNN